MPGWQRFVLVVLVGCWALPLSAQIYTWEDAQGRIHYADKKPAHQPHKAVAPSPSSIVSMGSNIQRGNNITRLNSAKTDTTQGRKKSMSKRARSKQKHAKKCAGYRARIARYDQLLRAGYKASAGNRLRSQRREISQKLSRECLLK